MEEITIETINLSKAFGNFWAVKNLNLKVNKGEIVAFLGPNGAGKTTTIRMLIGILKPTQGKCKLFGLSPQKDREKIMRKIGYVPDDPYFYDYLTGREIINFAISMHGIAGEETEDRILKLIKELDLENDLEEYTMNYSRGMKKKLGLICALIHDPDLLILDEPTTSLDPIAAKKVHKIILKYAQKGKTVFFSTHILSQAERLSKKAAIIFKGRLAAYDTIENLKKDLKEGSNLEDVFFALAKEYGY